MLRPLTASAIETVFDEPLSNAAFNFNLRRYSEAALKKKKELTKRLGGAVQVDPMKPVLKAPGAKHLKLTYDKLLSNLAFKFSLRHFSWGGPTWSPTNTRQGTYTRPLLSST